jgi:WD40 repeat protein
MPRFFLSHSSVDNREAIALKRWLVEQNPPLDNDIFLDLDPRAGIRPGTRWKDALQQASASCEAVICMLSPSWEGSTECRTEFRTAENLHKKIYCVRLHPDSGEGITAAWQYVDLFGDGPKTKIKIGSGDPVAFSTEGLLRLKDEIVTGIGPESFVWPPPGDPDRAPYRGWSPLEEVDAAVFFGRDAPLIRGLDQLRGMRESNAQTLFVILGPSGSGKSSFLRAGLLPRLRREDREFMVLDIVRPERQVLTGANGLAQSVWASGERMGVCQPQLADVKRACLADADRLGVMLYDIQQNQVEKLGGVAKDGTPPTLILPVDQAEELFGVDIDADEARRFLTLIKQHAQADIGYRVPLIVALTIRTDRHERLQTASELSEVPNKVFDDLKPMPRAQFIEVIEGPARRASGSGHRLTIEPALVQRLLDDCAEGADTLPLLSLTLERMYKDWGSDGDLQLSEYIEMGEISNVVQKEVDDLLSRDKTEKQKQLDILQTAFVQHLATVNPDNDQPVRRVARWDELPDTAKPLLEKFVARRLLVKDKRKNGDVIEVALESFLRQWDELEHWLDDERENLIRIESLERDARRWEANGRDDAYLLPGSRLADAESLSLDQRYHRRVTSMHDFLDASRNEAKSVRRRSTILRTALIVVVITGLTLALVGFGLYKASERNTAQRLVLESQQMLEGGRAGGDVRALLQLLAAQRLGSRTAEAIVASRRDLISIVENPARPDPNENPIKDVTRPVRSAAVSADGRWIASGSDDHSLRLYNADTGDLVHEVSVGTEGPVWGVAFVPSGTTPLVVTASARSGLQLWDAGAGTPIGDPMPGAGPVHSVASSADGALIATGGEDGAVRVWDRRSRTERFANKFRHGSLDSKALVRSLAFSPRDNHLVSGGDDKTVRLWDVNSGTSLVKPVGGRVTAVAFNSDGNEILVSRVDGAIEIRSGRDLALLRERRQAHPDFVNSAAFSPDGRRIVTGGADGSVRVWDSATLTPIGSPLVGHHGEIHAVTFNAVGTRIVSAGMDGSVRQWDAISAVPIPAGQGELRAAAFSHDGRQIATAGNDGTVKLWNRVTGGEIDRLGTPSDAYTRGDLSRAIMSLAFNDDGTRIATARYDGLVQLWDVTDGKVIDLPMADHQPSFKDPGRLIGSVAFNLSGSRIVSGGNDGALRLWDADSLQALPVIAAPYEIWAVAFSPDGSEIATGSGGYDNSLQLWDAASGTAIGEPMIGHRNWQLMSVAFGPKGDVVATGGYDGSVRVWGKADGRPLARMTGDRNAVLSVAFAHNQPWMVSGGTDGAVRLWDAATFDPIGMPLRGHGDSVAVVAFSPSDEQILSASRDGTFRLWSPPRDLTAVVCDKVNTSMSEDEWNQWVSRWIPYIDVCPKR